MKVYMPHHWWRYTREHTSYGFSLHFHCFGFSFVLDWGRHTGMLGVYVDWGQS
jgi:hypothetical protein